MCRTEKYLGAYSAINPGYMRHLNARCFRSIASSGSLCVGLMGNRKDKTEVGRQSFLDLACSSLGANFIGLLPSGDIHFHALKVVKLN
jgi:hypothetical protein